VKQFQGGLVCKARRAVYYSTLGWRAIEKKEEEKHLHQAPEALDRVAFLYYVQGLGFQR